MESRFQNPKGTVRTTSNVLRTNQLPRHLPTNHEPNVQRNEDAIPERIIRLHGRYPHRYKRRPNPTPNDRPPGVGQIRGRILLPPTRQMRIRERKNRLFRGRHQPRTNPHRPHQSRRPETMATKTRNPEASTVHLRNPRIPETLHPRICPHRPTTHQPPEKGGRLPVDGRTYPSSGQTNRHYPKRPRPLPTRPFEAIHPRSRCLRIRHRSDTIPRT